MISFAVLVIALVNLVTTQSCYWNDGCSFQLFSSKTPYDAVRGDIRDYPVPQNCRAVSVWSLNRHGNRNPGDGDTDDMKAVAGLRDQIVDSYSRGSSELCAQYGTKVRLSNRKPGDGVNDSIKAVAGLRDQIVDNYSRGDSGLCAQDIDDFKKWKWNETIEVSQSFLTGTGYEELYDIGRRIREKYPDLLEGFEDNFYFRTTKEQRTVTSSLAFVHGLTEGTNLNIQVDGPFDKDDVIRPYENCDRYQQQVKGSQELEDQLDAYYRNPEFITVQNNVQRRLNLTLSPDEIYSFYEICRFYRSWEPNLKSPWCSVFTNQDLVVLEYHDDVRHYYRNGYGSSVNVNLGGQAMKDLYESMEAARRGEGKNVVAYFTHDTMVEMALCAMGAFKDDFQLKGAARNPSRLWRTSFIGSFSANILAVLNRCDALENETYRVQLFVNEKVTELCPLEGCEWQDFQNKFQGFTASNLDFCTVDQNAPGAAATLGLSRGLSPEVMQQ